MAIRVRIPSPLRNYTDGKDSVETQGTNVGEVLNNVKSSANSFLQKSPVLK